MQVIRSCEFYLQLKVGLGGTDLSDGPTALSDRGLVAVFPTVVARVHDVTEKTLDWGLVASRRLAREPDGIAYSINFLEELEFQLSDEVLHFNTANGTCVATSRALSAREQFFVELVGTVGLLVTDGSWGLDLVGVGAVCLVGADRNRGPQAAVHADSGDVNSRAQILDHSPRWSSEFIMAPDAYLGVDDLRRFHSIDVYTIGRRGVRIPPTRSLPRMSCARCQVATADSGEHCTPDWLMNELGLHPVTARVVCQECNAIMGRLLEEPFSQLYLSGGEAQRPALTAQWAIKTAAMLAVASTVEVGPTISSFLAAFALDPDIQVFVAGRRSSDDFGYAVARLDSRSVSEGAFLFAMCFGRSVYLVASWPSCSLSHVPGMVRLHPLAASPALLGEPKRTIHEVLNVAMEALAQESIVDFSLLPTSARPERTPRG